MRYFKVVKNYDTIGKWIAFEVETSKPILYFSYWRNTQFKQWFSYITIFPFYFSKNNCAIDVGIYLIWIKIGFRFQGNFYKGVKRVKEIKELKFNFNL